MALLYKHPHHFMVPAPVIQSILSPFLIIFLFNSVLGFCFPILFTSLIYLETLYFAGFSSASMAPWGTEHRRCLLSALLRGKMEGMSLPRSMLSSIHKMTPLLKKLSRYVWSSHIHCFVTTYASKTCFSYTVLLGHFDKKLYFSSCGSHRRLS